MVNRALSLYRADLSSAHSPFRIVAQPDGREVDWINRFLDQCPIRGPAWYTLRGYAFDLTHFVRWWAESPLHRRSDGAGSHQFLLLDYVRYQADQQPRPAARTYVQMPDHSVSGVLPLYPTL